MAEESQRQFGENLSQLGEIKSKQDQTYKETETNIRQSSSLLLRQVQSGLVPIKFLNFVIVLDAPKLTSEQFRLARDEMPMNLEGHQLADETLRNIICGERNRIPFAEFRLILSGLPGVEYVLRRKISNDNNKEVCGLDSSLVVNEVGGKPHDEPISPTIYLVNSNLVPIEPVKSARRNRRMIVLTTRFLANENLPGQPLYASSFGEVQSATLTLSGEDEDVIISGAVEILEPVVPLSIAVNVQGWYSVLGSYKEIRPSFEKIWHLERIDRYDLGAGLKIEYKYVP